MTGSSSINTMSLIGIIFVLFLNVCVLNAYSSRPPVDCSAVSDRFLDMFGDYPSSSSISSLKESNFSVCSTSGESCCTPEMEVRFHVEAEEELHYQLQESTSFLGSSLYVNDIQFKNDYTQMLGQAKIALEDLFEEDYNRISGEVSSLLTTFFKDAKHFIFMDPGAKEITKFVDNFFDNLFPLVYIEEVNNRKIKSGVSKPYANCLATNRKAIRPFGNMPKWTKESFKNSLPPAKLLLQSIELGIKVINTTNNLKLTKACHNALTRMSYCQYCSGYVGLKPCNALCLNVMTGCFAGLYELDYDWSRFLAPLVRLTSSMSSDRDLERVLRTLPKRMINSLNFLRNNKETILEKANELCGDPDDVPQLFAVKTLQSLSGNRNRDFYNDQSMYVRINVFSYSLRNSEAFLRSLPNQICFLSRGASDFDSRCWTGKRFGKYQKFVWSGGIANQKSNSEVRLTGREPELRQTQELSEDLQLMRKLILASLSQNDGPEVSGSGSGCLGDDECEEGSGSTPVMTPTVATGDKIIKLTNFNDNRVESTKQPLVDITDSDFSFDNTHSQTTIEEVFITTEFAKDTTTKNRNPTTRQTTSVVDRSTVTPTVERSTSSPTQITDKDKPKTTEQPSKNKFIPTKLVTQRSEVDTQKGTGGGATNLTVVMTLLMAAVGFTLLL